MLSEHILNALTISRPSTENASCLIFAFVFLVSYFSLFYSSLCFAYDKCRQDNVFWRRP